MQGDAADIEVPDTSHTDKTAPLSSELLEKHDRLISQIDDAKTGQAEAKREPVMSGAARRAMFQRHSSGGGISQSMSMLPPHLAVDLDRKTTPLGSFRELTAGLQNQTQEPRTNNTQEPGEDKTHPPLSSFNSLASVGSRRSSIDHR